MKSFKSFLLATAFVLSPMAANAQEKITIIHPASATGNIMSVALSYQQDLVDMGYNVNVEAGGNACNAVALYDRTPGAKLVIWGSTWEYNSRLNQPDCLAPQFESQDVVSYEESNFFLCSANENFDFLAGGNTIGYWTGQSGGVHMINVLSNVNENLETNNRLVPYEGARDGRIAIENQEVDGGFMVSSEATRFVEEGKGVCPVVFGSAENYNFETMSMVNEFPNYNMDLSVYTIMFQSGIDVREDINSIHANTESNVNKNSRVFSTDMPEDVREVWLNSVDNYEQNQ